MEATLQATPHTHQLRSFIAPACPATRAPCDGSESAMRVEFGFTPRWYHERLGIDFGERWHLDPLYRRETDVAMRKELNRCFPELQPGGPDPDDVPASLNGVHGGAFMTLLFGLPARYDSANWPAALPEYLSPKQAAGLQPPKLEEVPAFSQVISQMDIMEREFGCIPGYLNWQGVLNVAFRLRGQDIFTDMVTDPPLVAHLFHVIAETMIAGMQFVYARQAATAVVVRHATLSNCVVNMLSPQAYREQQFPHDQRISEAFDHFGIHNCAWNVDPYIADYARIPKLGYVDMGLDSDLPNAKRLCPHARRAVMYTPTDLHNKSPEALRTDLERIRRELSPCDIVMADIDAETPDERVLEFARLAEVTIEIEPNEE
jgi:hypothetical protein